METLSIKTLKRYELFKDEEQEERVIDTVRMGVIVHDSDCCWPNMYIHQTVDEDGLHTEIVAVVVIIDVAVVSPNGDPKEKQTFQALCIGNI